MSRVVVIFFAFILDIIFGDPNYPFHPIRLIGKLITVMEKFTRSIFRSTPIGQVWAGGACTLLVILCTGIVSSWLLMMCYTANFYVGVFAEILMCYTILAIGSLKKESMAVYTEVKNGDIEKSRYAVSMIVGRDTKELSLEGVTKATVETVAENTSDGVVAPLIFIAFGGAVGGYVYKAINTLDSMIGYKNDTYINFGRIAARLDDVANYIPARVSAYLMIAAAWLLKFDSKNAYFIYNRDKHNHKSPNSAHTEAVCAGALGVELAGDAYYFGELVAKPTIGDKNREIECEDIARANKLMVATGALTAIICMGISMLI